MKLYDLKCEACTGKTPKLNIEDIYLNLTKLINWNINDEKEMIFKKYKFNSFKKALIFANSIGKLADKEGHHPDLSIGWGYCIIMLHTHAIKGLSINDFIIASKIDLLSN